MNSVRSIRRVMLAAFTATVVTAALAPAPSSAVPAAKPAWQILQSVGPTNLFQTTGRRNEVQRVRVESGPYRLTFNGSTTGQIECGATPASVQAELEALSSIGAGNVAVTEPEPSECGKFEVSFQGTLGYQPLPPIGGTRERVEISVRAPGRGGWGNLAVYLTNEGSAPSSGPVTLTVALPPGITTYETPEGTPFGERQAAGMINGHAAWVCEKGNGLSVLVCTSNRSAYPGFGPGVSPEGESYGAVSTAPLTIPLHVEVATPGQLMSEITVTGGGGSPLTTREPITISPAPASPGLEMMKARVYEADGTPAIQAGAHPFAITTGFFLHTTINSKGTIVPVQEVKNIETKLPPGFIGNPQAVPQCDSHGTILTCRKQLNSQIGVTTSLFGIFGGEGYPSGLWNIVPETKTPAEFGFMAAVVPVHLRASVRSDGDYGVTVSAPNTLQTEKVYGAIVTFWGKPNEPIHDQERCEELAAGVVAFGCVATTSPNTPFLTDPTDCVQQSREAPNVLMEVSSWQNIDVFTQPLAWELAPVDGCKRVPFDPSLHVIPTQHTAAAPSGLLTELHMPQIDSAEGVAEANVEKAVVTLPEGMTLSPAAAGGLSACSEAEMGLTSTNPLRFDKAQPACPESSKLGTFTIDTPLLPNSLDGNVYLAEQDNNPFGTLVAIYLYATDPVSGVEIKVAGRVDPDPVTGRITATFDHLPQLAFGDVKLTFKSGPRAPIMTPTSCGTFTATSDLTPTSLAGVSPGGQAIPGGTDVLSTDAVSIEGCKHSAYAPSFSAGTTNNHAAAFSPFTMTLTRNSDEEAAPSTISMTMPPGVSAVLSEVPLCGEPQASQGACPASSQIGHVDVVFGNGPNPLTLPEPGKGQDPVYLTGPYEGAPFGLSIAVPAEAGPFNLGRVVVRAKVNVDPHTGQVLIASDPMPTILRGVPTDLRVVNVTIDHQRFMFNPTNCHPTVVAAQIGSSEGTSAAVSSRYQAAGCASLSFKPGFKATTTAKTSRKDGAGLHVKLAYPKAPQGTQANIKSVRVELPKALPSRLSTLNHACLDSVFNQNPASCPSQSRVGFAKAITPILPVPLEGPAYFVSHGGQKFPELTLVLQGYGVTIYLEGETFISKAGITSSTFKAVPDTPVGSFELTLPEGPYSALAANTNLCAANLTLPTTFTAQNGAIARQNTAIEVQGCPYSLLIRSHKIHHRNLTLQVAVPGAGRLTAHAKGLQGRSKGASGRSTLTLTLPERRAGRLRTKVLLSFTPKTGKKRGKGSKALRKSLVVTFR